MAPRTLFVYALIFIPNICGYEIHTPVIQDPIKMGFNTTFQVSVYFKNAETLNSGDFVEVRVSLKDPLSYAVEILSPKTLTFDYEDVKFNRTKNVTLGGIIIGVNSVVLESRKVSDEKVIKRHAEDEIKIKVILASRILNQIFVGVLTFMVLINTINMGGQLDLSIIKEVFKKPIGPAVGFFCQFFLMPMISYGVGYIMFDNYLYRLGLFILGCCPGGTGSNFWCILLGGDLNLSITMTFVSTIAALGMMPLWVTLLGPSLSGGNLVIPYVQIIVTLLTLIVPVGIGMFIRYKSVKAGTIMGKVIVPCTIILVLFISTVGIWMNWFMFQLINGTMVLAGFMVAIMGYILGAGFAWILRLKCSQIIAVSIETTFQNAGIAFVLLKLSLDEPYGDMAAVPPVAQLMVTGTPLWLIFLGIKVYKRCVNNKAGIEKLPQEDIQDARIIKEKIPPSHPI